MNIITELRGKVGVYKITCELTGKCYVGSSIQVHTRLRQHRNELRKGIHSSEKLQRAWNKYGEQNFSCKLIEEVVEDAGSKNLLYEREQYWITTLDSYKSGYNASAAVIQHSRGVPKVGKKAKGIDNLDSAEYAFLSPDGVLYTGKNIRAFAIEHGLEERGLYHLRGKRHLSYKGWTLPNARENKLVKAYKKFWLVDPQGKIHVGVNMSQFAKQQGFPSDSGLKSLVSGASLSYRGWRNLYTLDKEPKQLGQTFEVLSPEGEYFKGTNCNAFCQEHGLTLQAFMRMLKGEQTNHKGWTKYEPPYIQLELF